jgi:hypothetical protein
MQCHSLVVDVVVLLLPAWKNGPNSLSRDDVLQNPLFRGLGAMGPVGQRRFCPGPLFEPRPIWHRGQYQYAIRKARLLKLVEHRPLPDFTKELEIETRAAFFLKWVISHPAITCALPARRQIPNMWSRTWPRCAAHLPDREMRQRMVSQMETIPGFDRLGEIPWYPGKILASHLESL